MIAPLPVRCILCDGDDFSILYAYRHRLEERRFALCERCGLTSLHPLPTVEELEREYAVGKHTDHVPASILARHRSGALQPSGKNLAILDEIRAVTREDWAGRIVVDMGAGFGRLTGSLAQAFPEARIVAVEPERNVAALLAAVNTNPRLEVEVSNLETFRPDYRGRVRAIFLMTVFEHLPRPLDALARIRDLLAPGGWTFLLVPDLMHPGTVYGPKSFFHAAHMYYYTDATLGALLGKAGFEAAAVLRGRSFSFSTGHGFMIAARKAAAPVDRIAELAGEADRVRQRVRQVARQTWILGPARALYRRKVKRTVRAWLSAGRNALGAR